MNRVYFWASVLSILAVTILPARATVKYVDLNATGDNSGSSWANAFTNLAYALEQTGGGTDLWVAAGTYYPGTARSNSFKMKSGVNLYGGLTNGMASLDERDWTNNETILSGDIQQDGLQTNNAYHVVIGTNNAAIDGFTLTKAYGYVAGDSDSRNGGGIRNKQVSPTVRNCKFLLNTVVSGGAGNGCGAGIYNYLASPLIENCTFISNNASYGADIYNYGPAQVAVTNCAFGFSSGRSMYNEGYATVTVHSCTFQKCAGAIENLTNTAVTIWNSAFVTNAVQPGGAIRNKNCSPGIYNCLFANNGRPGTSSGGAICNENATPIISNCIFSANWCSANGGAIYNYGQAADPLIVGCKFTANQSSTYSYSVGGAIFNSTMATGAGRIINCLFAGNYCLGQGGAINNGAASPTISNCTFSGNMAANGGGIYNTNSGGNIVNCILWTNRATSSGHEILNIGSTPTVSYSDINACGGSGAGWNTAFGTDGGGNINTNPLYVASLTGTWTAVGTCNPATGQTVLTNMNASWTPGALADTIVTPTLSSSLQFYVVTNSATSITVWGDASALGTNGAVYRINSCRLQSTAGHWTMTDWVADAQDSPGIDAGQPSSPYALEPQPNGERINMGFDGNTAHASKSQPTPGITVVIQ